MYVQNLEFAYTYRGVTATENFISRIHYLMRFYFVSLDHMPSLVAILQVFIVLCLSSRQSWREICMVREVFLEVGSVILCIDRQAMLVMIIKVSTCLCNVDARISDLIMTVYTVYHMPACVFKVEYFDSVANILIT